MSFTTTVQRRATDLGALLLPQQQRISIERRLRGWFEFRRLRRADAAVVSFGKSGRTWVRVMMSRYYRQTASIAGEALLEFDNLHRQNPMVPRILFTHDNYLGDYTGARSSKLDYAQQKVVLLVRDPADIAVSQYFQWRYRMRAHKKLLNNYPLGEVSMFEFVMGAQAGLPKIVQYLNEWAGARANLGDLLIVRYEDLRSDTAAELTRMMRFLSSQEPEGTVIGDAVEYASMERMREREAQAENESDRLAATDRDNPDSFKTRRGKVGGYRDYFEAHELAQIDQFIQNELSSELGYGQRG